MPIISWYDDRLKAINNDDVEAAKTDKDFIMMLIDKFNNSEEYELEECKVWWCENESTGYDACYNQTGDCCIENFKTKEATMLYLFTNMVVEECYKADLYYESKHRLEKLAKKEV